MTPGPLFQSIISADHRFIYSFSALVSRLVMFWLLGVKTLCMYVRLAQLRHENRNIYHVRGTRLRPCLH